MVLSRSSSLWITLAVASCGGNALNVGTTDGGPESGASTGPAWSGTLDGVELQDGSNRLAMTLSLAADGRATGTLLLGDGALLQPATDPDKGYPPGVQFPLPGGPLGFFEGFRYPMEDGVSTGSTLTFRVAEFDLWAQWCNLETKTYLLAPFESADGGTLYSCEPNASFNQNSTACSFVDPGTGKEIPVDCGKFELCTGNSPCACSATGCREAMTSNQLYIEFALVISGSKADGTVSGALGDHQVHFVRAP
jgi:hypothetical protein